MQNQTIYNTLSRKKENFKSRIPNKASLYVCGPTVYDYFHVGNARTFTVFDMVFRWLTTIGYEVNYARNITDIDDKIIQRANENNESIETLTSRMTAAMHEDFDRLNLLRPTVEPRATQHIDGMLDIIKKLETSGMAYRGANGDVYYAVREFPGYGKLSRKNPDNLRAGERVAVDQSKRDPLDFVLWKAARPNEPQWPSQFGNGRPGWHIECSAMCNAVHGEQIDIHGGGWDLQFPHHENEIAQSEGAFAKPFVNYWMHAAFLNMDKEKMSKSLGNFFTAREVLNKLDAVRGGEQLRFFLLRGHYRSEINYSWDTLMDAGNSLLGLYRVLKDVAAVPTEIDWTMPYAARFNAAMADDFDTPIAFAVLHELKDEVRNTRSAQLAGLLKALGGTLGLLQENPQRFIKGESNLSATLHGESNLSATLSTADKPVQQGNVNLQIEQLIAERHNAKKSKDFARADAIRLQLENAGIILEDKPGGITEWRSR